jgi:hypothetical protein
MIAASCSVTDAPDGTTLSGQPSSRVSARADGWTRDELDARVESLATIHEGDAFVQAVSRFADEELAPAERELLGRILLERADEEHAFEEVVRRRMRERGWIRRTLRRLDEMGRRGEVSEEVTRIAALVGREDVAADEADALLDGLRADRGRAARILDELSRHDSADVRAWVAWAAPQVLGEGGSSVLMGLTRDRDPDVREAAIDELVTLDPDAARRLVPALRRRLRSTEAREPVSAMWTLAELGDRSSLPAIRRLAEAKDLEHPFNARVAEIVCLLLEERGDEVLWRLRAHDHDYTPWLATAARVLGTESARAALAQCAAGAPDEECRRVCAVELERLEERSP